MNWLSTILTLAITGLIIGGLARLFLPGSESMGIFGTILAGLGGSFVGGLIVTYLLGTSNFWITLIVAVACACLFILPFRMYYAPTTVVVPRRSLFGPRTDYVVDDGYGAGYARRPFWRRRGVL